MSAVREKRDIEWLVNWALEKQGVFGFDTGTPAQGSGGGRLAMMQQLGTIVQVGSGGGSIKDVHPDAQVIGSMLLEMGRDTRISDLVGLVCGHGWRGDRPDWGSEGCGHYVLRRSESGKVKRRYADRRQARGLLGFEFEFHGYTHEEIEHLMIQYVGWRDALAALRDRVNRKLSRYEATGPAAPEAPWDQLDSVIHIEGEEPLRA